MKSQNDVPVCTLCGQVLKAKFQNNGWDGVSGPSMIEFAHYECTECLVIYDENLNMVSKLSKTKKS